MRVAGEVKKRMDEAQREMERNAVQRPSEADMDDDDDGKGGYGGDSDRRSVREGDRELLEGEEAIVGVGRGGNKDIEEDLLGGLEDTGHPAMAETGKVEFER